MFNENEVSGQQWQMKEKQRPVRKHHMPLYELDVANIPLRLPASVGEEKETSATKSVGAAAEDKVASSEGGPILLSGQDLKHAIDSYLKEALRTQLSQMCNNFQAALTLALK
ncbi:hypothetical protein FGO68_gene5986 [Halteria grandinella]|uniref:Uncharacterized protein n=1 Tax=Halteria grandinella TaxID=5974 RepID=A0A8J8NMZ1_HALGN|nr:hypothetical protein FGO68_gene5986 [Halteria grandinella]